MGELKKRLTILSALALLLLSLPFSSAAGMVIVYKDNSWNVANVLSEFGAVNFNGSTERLALAVTTPPAENGYWIIPILGNNVTAAASGTFPSFTGEILKDSAEKSLISIYQGLWATQIYPLPYLSAVSPTYSIENRTMENDTADLYFDDVNSMGVSAEVVGAGKLEDYLSRRNVVLASGMEALQPYSAQNYSFVISTIKNTKSIITRGLLISFVAEQPSFPASLSGIDPSTPRIIYIVGSYEVNLGSLNDSAVIQKYYNSKLAASPKEFFFMEKEGAKKVDYTRISLLAQPEEPVGELRIYEIPNNDYVFLYSIKNHPILWGLLVYAMLSCIASMAAGAIIFREDSPKVFSFFLFGFSNMLTLIGFWVRAYFDNVQEKCTESEKAINQKIELTTGKRVALAVPILLLVITLLMIPITLLLELGSIFGPMFMSNIFAFYFIPALVFTILVMWGLFREEKVLYFNLTFTGIFAALLIISFFIFTTFL